MKAVVQRVSSARVEVDGHTTGQIDRGLLVLLGMLRSETWTFPRMLLLGLLLGVLSMAQYQVIFFRPALFVVLFVHRRKQAGAVPALIDRSTFEAVQRRLALNKERAARNNRQPAETLLRGGNARCGY